MVVSQAQKENTEEKTKEARKTEKNSEKMKGTKNDTHIQECVCDHCCDRLRKATVYLPGVYPEGLEDLRRAVVHLEKQTESILDRASQGKNCWSPPKTYERHFVMDLG